MKFWFLLLYYDDDDDDDDDVFVCASVFVCVCAFLDCLQTPRMGKFPFSITISNCLPQQVGMGVDFLGLLIFVFFI